MSFISDKLRNSLITVSSILTAILLCLAFSVARAENKLINYNSSPPFFFQNVYFELGTGYTYADWAGLAANGIGGFTSVNSNRRGGAIFNAAIGYQYIRYLTFEANYFYLPLVKGANATGALEVKNWLVDLVAKLYYPVAYRFYLFAKLGVGYRQANYEGPGEIAVTDIARVWTPVYGAGLQYFFPKQFYATLQWLRIPTFTNSSVAGRQIPSYEIVYFTVGYRFLF